VILVCLRVHKSEFLWNTMFCCCYHCHLFAFHYSFR